MNRRCFLWQTGIGALGAAAVTNLPTFEFAASAADTTARSPASGPLRVHPKNPRYFTDGSGKAIYLTGSHIWNNLTDMGSTSPPSPFDFQAYLDFLEANGHNFIRLWRWELSSMATDFPHLPKYWDPHPWPRSGPGVAKDGGPRFDLSKFNPTYFDRLRARVLAARDRNIYVSIMLFEGCLLRTRPSQWAGHPMNAANNVNGINGDSNADGFGLEIQTSKVAAVLDLQKAYVRKAVDTVNDLDNVLYEISNESQSSPELLEWQEQMIRYVRQIEAGKPKQHPVGMTDVIGGPKQNNPLNGDLFASSADWISPGVVTWGPKDVYSLDPPAVSGKKVEILDSDHTWNNACGSWSSEKRADRAWVWKSFLRGYHVLYMDPLDLSRPDRILEYARGNAAAVLSARRGMGQALAFSEKINLAAMTPQGGLSTTGYCLATPGKEYLAYQPAAGAFQMQIDAPEGVSFAVEWFDPKSGRAFPGKPLTDRGKITFEPPFAGDAVLYLKVAKRGV